MTGGGVIPGMEGFVKNNDNDEEEFFVEGKELRYFDASILADAPVYQRNASGNQTYVLHIIFPTQEELVRAITALTMGKRKSIAKTAKEGTINGIARKDNKLTWLEHWENIMLGANNVFDDGETEPEIIPGETYPEEKPTTKKKPVKSKPKKETKKVPEPKAKKKEIKVVSDYPSKLHCLDKNVLIAFPTYKRSSDVKTWKNLESGISLGFVEPHEEHLYKGMHSDQNIITYDKDGMTINEKRNYIVEFAIKEKYRWLFMLEDDLTGFFIRQGKTKGGSHKLVRTDYKTTMNAMLNFANANEVAELGLSQQQSNHYYEEELVKYSCKVTEFCLFDLHKLKSLGINYDVTMPHFEDFDISIQLLLAGEKVGLFTPFAFGHVTMATNKTGGFVNEGMEKRRELAEKAISMMEEKYPGVVTRGEGRLFPEPKVNWSLLRDKIEV